MKNLLPEYYELLGEASEAQQALDDYDLDSSNPQSMAAWRAACNRNHVAQLRLATYVQAWGAILIGQLDL